MLEIGQVFERLTVVSQAPKNKHGQAMWVVECRCGTIKIVSQNALRRGLTKSCGCLNYEINKTQFLKHGMNTATGKHPLYCTWDSMKQRCTNPNNASYGDYGGRGITVCDEWVSFEGFLKDMQESWREGLEIDRTDNNGNYCKENCRWVTHKENMKNRRVVKLYDGFTLEELCKNHRMNYKTVESRVRLGWTLEDALHTRQHGLKLTIDEITKWEAVDGTWKIKYVLEYDKEHTDSSQVQVICRNCGKERKTSYANARRAKTCSCTAPRTRKSKQKIDDTE